MATLPPPAGGIPGSMGADMFAEVLAFLVADPTATRRGAFPRVSRAALAAVKTTLEKKGNDVLLGGNVFENLRQLEIFRGANWKLLTALKEEAFFEVMKEIVTKVDIALFLVKPKPKMMTPGTQGQWTFFVVHGNDWETDGFPEKWGEVEDIDGVIIGETDTSKAEVLDTKVWFSWKGKVYGNVLGEYEHAVYLGGFTNPALPPRSRDPSIASYTLGSEIPISRVRDVADVFSDRTGIVLIRHAIVYAGVGTPKLPENRDATSKSTSKVFSHLPAIWFRRETMAEVVVIAVISEFKNSITDVHIVSGNSPVVVANHHEVGQIVFSMKDVLFVNFRSGMKEDEIGNYLPHRFVVFEENSAQGVLERLFMVQREEIAGKAVGRMTETW